MDFTDLNVLIIDDEEDICDVLSSFLEFKNIKSKYVHSIKDALKLIEKENFNIIFLDNRLPDGKGVDYLKKGYFKKNNPFIVLMTGFFKSALIKDTLKAGVNEFILKPFKLDDIEKILFKAKNVIKSFYDFKSAVKTIKCLDVQFVIDNNVDLIKGIAKIIARNVVDAEFFDTENQPLIAITEVVSNAIYHGNLEIESSLKENSFLEFQKEVERRINISPYKERKVFIHSYFNKEKFVIKVRDEGKGFDWKRFLDKLNMAIESSLPHGRGIYILVAIFDEVLWNDRGNEITLIKYKIHK